MIQANSEVEAAKQISRLGQMTSDNDKLYVVHCDKIHHNEYRYHRDDGVSEPQP